MKTEIVWTTPNGEELVAKLARVSNPGNENNTETAPRLIKYLIDHRHWSPFEMVNACVYIECPRDISRQILRHRSFNFQEFSGRYAAYESLNTDREVRLQDQSNRQNSVSTDDPTLVEKWAGLVSDVRRVCSASYETALNLGVAKEVARSLLPEGLVPTRMYMNGTLRSWLHYLDVRTGPETQKEHRLIAESIQKQLEVIFPVTFEAFNNNKKSSTNSPTV